MKNDARPLRVLIARNIYPIWATLFLVAFTILIYYAIKDSSDNLFFFASCTLAVALALLSIHWSAKTLETFYNFKNVGIVGAAPKSFRRSTDKDQYYFKQIKPCKRRIILSGSSLSGWFRSDDFIKEFKDKLSNDVRVDLLFLDPECSNFADRMAEEHETAGYTLVDRSLRSLNCIKRHEEHLRPFIERNLLNVYWYDAEPVSVLVFDNNVLFDIYLPGFKNKDVPRLELERGGLFADVVHEAVTGVVERIENGGKRMVSLEDLNAKIAYLNLQVSLKEETVQ